MVSKGVSITIRGAKSKERKKNGGWQDGKDIVATERFCGHHSHVATKFGHHLTTLNKFGHHLTSSTKLSCH